MNELVAVGIPPEMVIVSAALVTVTFKFEVRPIGAVIVWLPLASLICAAALPVLLNVILLVPASVYLLGLLKLITPTVCGASTFTVRGAVMVVRKFAAAPTAFGGLAVQLLGSLQLWVLSSTFHSAGAKPPTTKLTNPGVAVVLKP